LAEGDLHDILGYLRSKGLTGLLGQYGRGSDAITEGPDETAGRVEGVDGLRYLIVDDDLIAHLGHDEVITAGQWSPRFERIIRECMHGEILPVKRGSRQALIPAWRLDHQAPQVSTPPQLETT
jgi:hypothetical protein